MNTVTQQKIALFMITLVLFIPFYVSDVHAASLNIRSISGVSEVDGFINTNDILTIEAEASISTSEDVEPDKMRIYMAGGTGYTVFQACTLDDITTNTFLCTYVAPIYNMHGTKTFTIDLHTGVTQYDPDGTPIETVSRDITIDTVGAKVTSMFAVPNRSTQGVTNITYTAKDFGSTPTDNQYCVGVERIEFYLGDAAGELIKTEYPSQYLCDYSSEFTHDFGTADGTFTICAKAYDRMNQTQTGVTCTDYFIDSGAPAPDSASLNIFKKGTEESIKYIGTNSILSDISFLIDAQDLVVDSVRADLSNLAGSRFADAPPTSHDADGSIHVFEWSNVPIGPITACLIEVDAEDVIGNFGTSSIQCTIIADNDGPVINSLFTNFESSGVYYIGKNVTLKAKIAEAGIGLERGNIFIDFSNLGLGSRMKADVCNKTEAGPWDCIWQDVQPTVRDGIYPVTVLKESRDDLDNIMNASFIQQIGVDRTSPEINSEVHLNVIAGVTEIPYENITIPGDTLEFIIQVSDAWSATANLSDLGGAHDALADSCWRENESTYCLWEVPITVSGPYDANIEFSFLDFTGNYNTISKSIFVSGVEDDENPNYWEHSVSCTPQFVDREISSLINQPVFCHIDLRPINAQNADVIAFNMEQYPANCYSTTTNVTLTDYVQNILVTNNHVGSSDPYLQLTLQIGEFAIDNLNFNCEFEMFTKMDDIYTLFPEVENISINLQFYDLPIGYLDDGIDNAIERHEDKIKWMGSWLDEVKLLYDYAAKVCQVYNSITSILAGITALSALLGLTNAIWDTGYGGSLRAAWVGTCSADGSVKQTTVAAKESFFDKFCSFVNCKYTEKALKGMDSEGWTSGIDSPGIDAAIKKGFDVKESIVWSAATLCIPGIILNLEKYRQVECGYILCMKQDVASGIPASVCEASYAYLSCVFWTGQILNALPFFQLWTSLMESFVQVVSDPLGFAFYITNLFLNCNQECANANAAGTKRHAACSILGTIDTIGDAISEFNNIKGEDYFTVGSDEDFCSQLEDFDEDEDDEDEDE